MQEQEPKIKMFHLPSGRQEKCNILYYIYYLKKAHVVTLFPLHIFFPVTLSYKETMVMASSS